MSECDSNGLALPVVMSREIIQVAIEATESAQKAMRTAVGEDYETKAIIISVDSGGCSGYMYDMKIIDEPSDNSYQEIIFGEVKVLVHNEHSTMLNGLVLDFKDSLMGGGFVMENPNASKSCGCGQSFR